MQGSTLQPPCRTAASRTVNGRRARDGGRTGREAVSPGPRRPHATGTRGKQRAEGTGPRTQAAWQRYAGGETGEPTGDYLLSYPRRLVVLECDWELTAEEMAIAGAKLATAE